MAKRLDVNVYRPVDSLDMLGESPVWSAEEHSLYWVDILAPAVHRWTPSNQQRCTWRLPTEVGSIGLRQAGGLVLAMRNGFHLMDCATGALTPLANPEPDKPTNRLNDGKVAPDGSFWAGSMDERLDKSPVGSLYRLGADQRCQRMATGFKVSNGLAWSPDGCVLYHSDSRAAMVWRYRHDPATGCLGERKLFVAMAPEWGRPDGAAVDAEGCYWNCGIGAGRINRFSPRGELLSWMELPLTHTTMPCFGGPALKTLYVTSTHEGLSERQRTTTPPAGALLAIDLDIAGMPATAYAG